VQPIEILGRITREPWISTRLHPIDFADIFSDGIVQADCMTPVHLE
jgi:hypothetical protein